MNKDTIIVIVLVALILVSVVQALQLTTLKSKITGNVVGSSSASNDQGQTYEEMMAEMHPELYGEASQGPTMVGGC
ncbi:MAG: hypothetical protein AABX55_01525 [Nanoarchaeota archaeon]